MVWQLKVLNPSTTGEPQPICKSIPADSLTQAIQKSSIWISPNFNGFSLVRIA